MMERLEEKLVESNELGIGTRKQLEWRKVIRDKLIGYDARVKELKELKAMTEELEALESPVLHCRFIGECFIGEEATLNPQLYNPSRSTGIIVAIH
jgi:hypothetical protein